MVDTVVRKVLIVCRDTTVSWPLTRELALKRMASTMVASGKECLDELRRFRYDLVFLDDPATGADGIVLLRSIRNASPGTRVVILGGCGSRGKLEEAVAAGVHQFLPKPPDPSLVDRILSDIFSEQPDIRKEFRYICDLRVWIRPLEAGAGDTGREHQDLCGKADEVGPDGIRIHTIIPLEKGTIVRLLAADPNAPFAIFLPEEGAAEVQWVDAEPPEFVAGLRFLTRDRTSSPGTGANRS